jgi:hypothetical protein
MDRRYRQCAALDHDLRPRRLHASASKVAGAFPFRDVDHSVGHALFILSLCPRKREAAFITQFCAAISLQEASSIGDVSTFHPCAAGPGFHHRPHTALLAGRTSESGSAGPKTSLHRDTDSTPDQGSNHPGKRHRIGGQNTTESGTIAKAKRQAPRLHLHSPSDGISS